MASHDSGSKRQRLLPRGPGIEDLPETLLTLVASHLEKPSRALFALAMTGPASSWRKIDWSKSSPILKWATAASPKRRPSAAALAILSPPPRTTFAQMWSHLNFGDLEKSLAAKLTDDDIAGVLACMNAHSTLIFLGLDGCTSITGACLKILWGSGTLVGINLCMHEPFIDTELSKDIVLPILNSILGVYDPSLKFVGLPIEFHVSRDELMDEFVEAFNSLFLRRYPICHCGQAISVVDHGRSIANGAPWYGMSTFCCKSRIEGNPGTVVVQSSHTVYFGGDRGPMCPHRRAFHRDETVRH